MTSMSTHHLDELSTTFETASPTQILTWAAEQFAGDMLFACSFQDLVLLDLLMRVAPRTPVVFLDTEDHFDETLELVAAAQERYGFELITTTPGPEAAAVPCGIDGCCSARKVAPLKAAVNGKAAWITALKRCDASTRETAAIVSYDEAFGLVKINPMATWNDDDIAAYERDHELLVHPLIAQGYLSIGCRSTTRPVRAGEDPRSGRWAGSDKVECGLHE